MIDQVLRLSFVLLARFIIWIRPFLPAVCFVAAWSTVVLTLWNMFSGIRQGVQKVKQLHKIPCAGCDYATNSHYLKCSLHPSTAFSEDAIGCQDMEPRDNYRDHQLTLG
ncbi:MAG: hypothetical protein ACFB0D_06460 [Phormidesmis sp.]